MPSAKDRQPPITDHEPLTDRLEPLRLLISIDGAARGNPGPAAIGVVIRGEGGETLVEISQALGTRTNNQAEYEALLAALHKLIKLKSAESLIRTDSELLYCQMIGRYRVKNPQLRDLHAQAQQLLAQLPKVCFERIPREQNREADKLANKALDKPSPQPQAPSPKPPT